MGRAHAERRYTTGLEVRKAEGQQTLTGYAAVFDALSENLGGFREKIAKGAFTESLKSGPDIVALVGHNDTMVLGRRSAKTLRVKEDSHGLHVEIDVPDTSVGRDTVALVERGDLNAMSFGFVTKSDAWEGGGDDQTRTVKAAEVSDVSVVAYPAYPTTEVEVALRSLKVWRQDHDPPQTRGQHLSGVLSAAVDALVTDERPRADIIEELAQAAGISTGTVNQILNGDIMCPPLGRLEGFAEVLDVSVDTLVTSAVNDGCDPDAYRSSQGESRTVVAFEATPTVDEPWDSTAAELRVREWATDDDEIDFEKYRRAFAWFDSEDADTLGAYKLPHHDFRDGRLVVNRRGMIAAMGALLGARGGVDIPDADKERVHGHLARHYAQYDLDPPEFVLRDAGMGLETAKARLALLKMQGEGV